MTRIDGKANVLDALFDMIRGAKKEVNIVIRYWGNMWGDEKLLKDVLLPDFAKAIESAITNGAKVQVLGDANTDKNGVAEMLKQFGAEVRDLEGANVRFAVVDRSSCLFAVSEPYTEIAHYYHAIQSESNELVEFFSDHFEALWPSCKKI